MTHVHHHMPAELEAHAVIRSLGPCLICLLFAKGDQVARTREMWEPLVNDGKPGQKWIEYGEQTPIGEAVIMGISDVVPGLPLIPVCWDHLAALAPPDPRGACPWCKGSGRKSSKLEAATQPLPPGLKRGIG